MADIIDLVPPLLYYGYRMNYALDSPSADLLHPAMALRWLSFLVISYLFTYLTIEGDKMKKRRTLQ